MCLHAYIITLGVFEKDMNKLLLSYLLIIGIAGTAGAGSGIVLKRTLGPIDEVYPPGFSPDEFKDDVNALYESYLSLPDKTKFPNSWTNSDIVNVALEKYRRTENSYSLGIGLASTIIEQYIRSAQIRNGEKYFEEQISYSDMVAVANRSIQIGEEGDVALYSGSATGIETASYPIEASQTFSKSDYKDYLGKSLDEMFIYIISNKTTLSSSKKTINESGDLEINLKLEPNSSTFYYKIQMKNISGLSNLPPFSDVSLTYTLSNDLTLKHLYVDETYTATKAGIPVPAKTHNTIDYYYYANQELDIPDSNTAIDYKVK